MHTKNAVLTTTKCLETWHCTCWITTTPAKSMSVLDNEHNVLNMTMSVFLFTNNSECWTYANRNAADWYHQGDVFAWWMVASLFGTQWAQTADETIKSISLRGLPTGQLVCSLSIFVFYQTVQWAQALGCHGHTSHIELGLKDIPFYMKLACKRWQHMHSASSSMAGDKVDIFRQPTSHPISKREI